MTSFKFASPEATYKREKVGNILAASFFGIFVLAYTKELLVHFRSSLLLMLIKETLDISFFLCRKAPKQVNYRVISWVIAIGATLIPLLLRPSIPPTDSIIGTSLQYIGFSSQIFAIISLNKSWGIVPALRDIKTNGTYRFVRHPLYLSYFIAVTGFVINNFNYLNLSILLLFIALQVYRIQQEEELLSQDQRYLAYTAHTRWRVIPFIY